VLQVKNKLQWRCRSMTTATATATLLSAWWSSCRKLLNFRLLRVINVKLEWWKFGKTTTFSDPNWETCTVPLDDSVRSQREGSKFFASKRTRHQPLWIAIRHCKYLFIYIYIFFIETEGDLAVFKSVIVIIFKNIFYLKIYENNIFLFLKIILTLVY